jgi:hypothetical protein
MAATQAVIDAAAAGDDAAVQRLLSSSVELTHSDGKVARGAHAVAGELCAALKDAQVIPFVADETAAAVEVVRPGAPRIHQRYFISAGRVSRIVVE